VDLFLAICQGLGLALAIGIGGALVALFTSAMASLELGFDPDGTDFGFVAETWFLVILLALVVIGLLARGREAVRLPMIALLSATGALAFAASLAEDGDAAWPGLLAGAIATFLAASVAYDVLAGAIGRARGAADSDDAAASAENTLVIAFGLAGLVLAALALFLPPVALVAAAALAFVAAGRRRRAGEKYEGLRILR
jgi:hypothetical protein